MGYLLSNVDSRVLVYDLLLLFGMLLLPLIAEIWFTSTFKKYSRVSSSRGLTAEQAARRILDHNGLFDVMVEHMNSPMGDCYVPHDKVIYLSDSTYGKTSIAAIGAAAHECGHACQFSENYAPAVLSNMIAPVMSFCSRTWYIVFLIGCFISVFPYLMYAGVAMFSVVVLYQLVILPMELNASRRAIRTLEGDAILEASELSPVRKVLTAAAMTYIVGLAASAMQLLRLLLRSRR